MSAAAHCRAVIVASLAGMSRDFDTFVVAGIASTARIIFLCTLAHIIRSIRPRPQRRWLRQPRHAASRRLDVFDLGASRRSCVNSCSCVATLRRRISILRRRRHRRIFNARSAAPHADRTFASTRCVRRIVPTLNFVTGILLADGRNFFRLPTEGTVILAYFCRIFPDRVRAWSRRRRRDTLDFESADRRRLSGNRCAFESRSIRILAR